MISAERMAEIKKLLAVDTIVGNMSVRLYWALSECVEELELVKTELEKRDAKITERRENLEKLSDPKNWFGYSAQYQKDTSA